MMFNWYADNTEFRSEKNAKAPNIFLFGGIIISKEEELKLIKIIESVKSKYTHKALPIKWNFKDVKDKYVEFNRENEYNSLLEQSAVWRKELFKKSLAIDYTIIIAAIENFRTNKTKKDIKEELIRYVFSNALMRVAFFAKKKASKDIKIILDWPENSNPKPFNVEYFYAFHEGKTSNRKVSYLSGALKHLNFHHASLFCAMNHSPCLQFADLVIGATKDFLDMVLNPREHCLGKECVELIIQKFDGYPRDIIKRGINISSNNQSFKSKIKSQLEKYAQAE